MKTFAVVGIIGGLLFMAMAEAQEAVTRISALANGALLLDGQRAELGQIEEKLRWLRETRGMVWYYREDAKSEPTREAMSVIELVVKYGLPISMSSKPDFSDYIDENGRPHPRIR